MTSAGGSNMQARGEVAPGFERVREAFELGHQGDPGGSQLCIYRHGERVVDLWIGSDLATNRAETGDTLHVLMSTTKGALALLAAMLAERSLLDVDGPVGEYWPEYAVDGKERSTAAHFLTHTAGLSAFRAQPRVIAGDLSDWEFCTRVLAESEPYFEPGTAFAYHAITYGFLVGEVLRRVTGSSAGQLFAAEVATPLGLDFWIGLPPERLGDVALQAARTSRDLIDDEFVSTLTSGQPSELIESGENLCRRLLDGYLATPAGRTCELGAVNGIANARSVAKMYAATIGDVDGVRLLSADTLAASLQPRNRETPFWSPFASSPDAWKDYGLGFLLSNPYFDAGSATVFGHAGAGGPQGFASPELGVAVGYTSSALHLQATADPRTGFLTALADLVRA
jgi:CubicO group peptidase (beta-lactamase class C family)